jgi:hypothetical protein
MSANDLKVKRTVSPEKCGYRLTGGRLGPKLSERQAVGDFAEPLLHE